MGIGRQYDTDKSEYYLQNYERLFSEIIDRDIRLLELGIFAGGSLLLWRDYFAKGLIVGLDVNPVTIEDKTGRIRTYQGLQQDTALLDRIRQETAGDGFDIIIDDASHIGKLAKISFWYLFDNHLKPGGLYVIEDWGTGYWRSWVDGKQYRAGRPHLAGMVGLVKELIDECAAADITHPEKGIRPRRESRFEFVQVFGGQVFVKKRGGIRAARAWDLPKPEEERHLTEVGAPIFSEHSESKSEPLAPRGTGGGEDREGSFRGTDFVVTAIISAYNEGDIIYHVIGALVGQGIRVYLIVHSSADNTVEEAARWLGQGLIHIERFPEDAAYPQENKNTYIWRDILRRKEELATELEGDWFIHHDADEFRESPWPGLSLYEAIKSVDGLGYSAIDFELLNFRPVDNSFVPGRDVREFLKYFEWSEDFNKLQIKAWKKQRTRVDLQSSGGHEVRFEQRQVFPIKFILRHYPIRTQSHGEQKIFEERQKRFDKKELALGWHKQYDAALKKHDFLRSRDSLNTYDENVVRLKILSSTIASVSPARAWQEDARHLKQEVGDLENELQGIYASHGWKFLSSYYRLRDRVKRKIKSFST